MLPLENITFGQLLRRTAERYPQRPAMWYGGETVSYRELETRVAQCAQQMLTLGIRRGSRAALLTDPNVNGLTAMYALLYIGATAVMLNTSLRPAELLALMEQTDADFLLLGHSEKDAAGFDGLFIGAEMPPQLKGVVRLESGAGSYRCLSDLPCAPEAELEAAAADVTPQDTATILFTSGSTSRPKAVCTSHYSRVNGGIQQAHDLAATEEDRFCVAMPVYHCFCISTNLIAALAAGGCVCLPHDRHTASVTETIERAGCTVLNSVPTMFRAMLAKENFSPARLASLRIGIIAGAGCTPAEFEYIQNSLGGGFTLMSSLGQTECTAGLTVCNIDDPLSVRSRTVGHFMSHVEGKIADMSTGRELPCGETGEICVRGYLALQCYYGDPEATAKTLDAGGWVHTGDLGRLDAAGNITLCGRCKELIIRGGENISPVEIEQAIEKNPAVAECKVVGVPDVHFGEEICALIRLKEGALPDAVEIRERLRPLLAYFKVPRYILFCGALPKTQKGAISAGKCRMIAMHELFGAPAGEEDLT